MVACGGNREEQIQSLTQQDCRHVDRHLIFLSLLLLFVDKICTEAEKKEDERTQ